MSKSYRRKLSDTERLWVGASLAFHPFTNQLIFEGTGSIDISDLIHAVGIASAANPGSRLVLKGFLRGCHWVDSGITPPIRKVDCGSWDGRSGDNAPFFKRRLPHKGPTCEVLYIEGNIPRIAFRSNHAVMDGRGMLTWIEDVFRILRGEKPIGSASGFTDYELIQSISDKKKKLDYIDCIAPTGKMINKSEESSWKRITISGNHLNVNGKISIALARSAWKYQEGRFRIAVPVDLRPRIKGLRSTGNLSNAIYHEITKNSTSRSVGMNLYTQIKNKNDCINIDRGNSICMVPIRLIAVIFKIVWKISVLRGLYAIPTCISNLGSLDMARFSGGGFKADTMYGIPLGNEGKPAPAFVQVSGTSGKIEICVGVPNMISDTIRLDHLMDDIKEAFE